MKSISIKKAPDLTGRGAIFSLMKIVYMKTRLKIVGRWRDKNFKLIEQELNHWALPVRARVLYAGTSEAECLFQALRYSEKQAVQSDETIKQPVSLKMFLCFENPDDYPDAPDCRPEEGCSYA